MPPGHGAQVSDGRLLCVASILSQAEEAACRSRARSAFAEALHDPLALTLDALDRARPPLLDGSSLHLLQPGLEGVDLDKLRVLGPELARIDSVLPPSAATSAEPP